MPMLSRKRWSSYFKPQHPIIKVSFVTSIALVMSGETEAGVTHLTGLLRRVANISNWELGRGSPRARYLRFVMG